MLLLYPSLYSSLFVFYSFGNHRNEFMKVIIFTSIKALFISFTDVLLTPLTMLNNSSDSPPATFSPPPNTTTPTLSPSPSPPEGSLPPIPHHKIFLETSAAQAIAGAFVWAALIITCHQVSLITFFVAGAGKIMTQLHCFGPLSVQFAD